MLDGSSSSVIVPPLCSMIQSGMRPNAVCRMPSPAPTPSMTKVRRSPTPAKIDQPSNASKHDSIGCHRQSGRSHNGKFLRHRFSSKPKVIATPHSLPKRNHVAKEAVRGVANQNATKERAPRTKPRPCVKTMLCDRELPLVVEHVFGFRV